MDQAGRKTDEALTFRQPYLACGPTGGPKGGSRASGA